MTELLLLIAALLVAPIAQAGKFSDFNNDGKSDIFWRNTATGENYLYPMDGLAVKSTEGYLRSVPDQNWQVGGVGDFNGDGAADILRRNRATGENYIFLMNGTTILGTEGYIRTIGDQRWQVAAVGDYDGDGKYDILWRDAASGEDYLYPMNGTTILPTEGSTRTVPPTDWRAIGQLSTRPGTVPSCTTITPSGGALTPSLIASRVSGVAPLAVFFEALLTTATATTRPFSELDLGLARDGS